MLNKSASIEFFGMPGSGKSYYTDLLRLKLKNKNYTVYNPREIIVIFSKKAVSLSFFEKISLNYYKIINFRQKKIILKKNISDNNKKININFNEYTNIFKENYLNVCKKLVYSKKKYSTIIKKIEYSLNKNISIEKKQYIFWIYELLAAHILFKKYLSKKRIIFLIDEGFVQRSFTIHKILNYKINNKFFNSFFSIFPLADKIIFINSTLKKTNSINIERKKKMRKKYKDKNDLINMNFF